MEGKSEDDRSGLSFPLVITAAIRRFAAQRAGFGLQNLLSIHLGIFGRPSNGSVASDERLEHHKQTMPGGKQRPKKRHGRNSKTTVGKLR